MNFNLDQIGDLNFFRADINSNTSDFNFSWTGSNNTLVGILPLPHAIVMRKYEPNAKTNTWFTTLLFGAIFTHSNRKLPIFEDMKEVRLFNIIPI